MNPKLQAWAARFDALSQRERAMVAAAVIVGIGFLGFSLFVEPHWLRARAAEKSAAQSQLGLTTAETQLALLRSQMTDPDGPAKVELAELRRQLDEVNGRLKSVENTLVTPERMPAFLQSLLGRHRNLELVEFRSLAPVPAVERPAEAKPDGAGKSTPPAASSNLPNLYKHGVEIKLAGSYADLLAYLTELEAMPDRVLWNKVSLTTDNYPRSVLTVTVYTLSLDKQWLIV
ncbi:MAG: hypothetical protein EG825_12940 [Rhodocyclaceae bacterium]|nr:hypothetical protein [Rhodocyclaceae bacterium]